MIKTIITAALLTFFTSAIASALPLNVQKNVYSDGLYKSVNKTMPGTRKIQKHFDRNSKIIKEAKELETVLISKMIEPMFPDGEESGLYGGGQGNDIYRMMMIDEYGKIFSKSNGLGIAENIAKDLGG